MAVAKYQQYFKKMLEENQALFADFQEIHDLYQQDKQKHQEKFNQLGFRVRDVARDWERRLCAVMGKGQYSQFAQKVSEKFWNLVRKKFTLIDMVGVKIEK